MKKTDNLIKQSSKYDENEMRYLNSIFSFALSTTNIFTVSNQTKTLNNEQWMLKLIHILSARILLFAWGFPVICVEKILNNKMVKIKIRKNTSIFHESTAINEIGSMFLNDIRFNISFYLFGNKMLTLNNGKNNANIFKTLCFICVNVLLTILPYYEHFMYHV